MGSDMPLYEAPLVTAVPERDFSSTALLTTGLVLAAATMTFGALITVFFIRSQGKLWGHLTIPSMLWVTTAILLASSATLERGRRALHVNRQRFAFREFSITLVLGGGFLLGQILAWVQVVRSGVVLANNSHSWFIFLFIALHGLHILLGLTGVGALAMRTKEPAGGPRYVAKTRAITLGVSIFWHYLSVLWVVLFGLLLLWKR